MNIQIYTYMHINVLTHGELPSSIAGNFPAFEDHVFTILSLHGPVLRP